MTVHSQNTLQSRNSLASTAFALLLLALFSGMSLSLVHAEPVTSSQEEQETEREELSDAAYEAQAIAQGQALVEANCASCHAIGMDDKSTHEKAPPFREVVLRYPTESLAEALAEGIETGHPDMPIFVFEPPQIEAFLAYLNSLAPEDPRDQR